MCSIYLRVIRASCSFIYQWNCGFSLCGHTAFPFTRRKWCPLYKESNLFSLFFSTCSKCMQLLFDALALLLKIILSLFGILTAILKLSIQCLSDAHYILLLGTPEVLER